MSSNAKSQAFYTDFVIAILIFTTFLIMYFTYTNNLSEDDAILLNELIADAKTISSSLTSGGFPDNWNINNVARVGFTDNDNRINNAKFNEFVELDYNASKKLLGTINDYFAFFFVNESGDVQNVEGVCGIGHPDVNVSYNIKAAYYYQNREEEQFLKSFMENVFDATIYCNGGPKCDFLPFSDFLSDIDDYDFIVVEHPTWSTSDFNSFESAVDPWIQNGGILFVGGQIPSSQGALAFGVKFFKKSGQSESDRLSTVVNEDEFVTFDLADNIIFRQAYYIEDVSVGANLKDIARFNGSWIEFDDIKANGDIALARWPKGEGKILFFSDFDANYLAGNFQKVLEGSAKKWANADCLPINISNIQRERLVALNRLLIYNSEIVNMVLFVWS